MHRVWTNELSFLVIVAVDRSAALCCKNETVQPGLLGAHREWRFWDSEFGLELQVRVCRDAGVLWDSEGYSGSGFS